VTDDLESPAAVGTEPPPTEVAGGPRGPEGTGAAGDDGAQSGERPGDDAHRPVGPDSGGGAAGQDFAALAGDGDDRPKPRVSRTVIEWGVLIVAAVVIAVVIKTFLFQAFYIPSASMEPTLEVGDRVLVNKLSYDLHDVHRGDIVVFAAEPNQEWHKAGIDDLVKRVIALPGETVTQCSGERVCIDGKLLDEKYLPKGTPSIFPTSLPKLADGTTACAPGSPDGGCKVPPGMVWVMGDNRTNSQDSRANGPIKQSSIVGRVFVRIWPLNRLGLL
jgi:signal peptidase I